MTGEQDTRAVSEQRQGREKKGKLNQNQISMKISLLNLNINMAAMSKPKQQDDMAIQGKITRTMPTEYKMIIIICTKLSEC